MKLETKLAPITALCDTQDLYEMFNSVDLGTVDLPYRMTVWIDKVFASQVSWDADSGKLIITIPTHATVLQMCFTSPDDTSGYDEYNDVAMIAFTKSKLNMCKWWLDLDVFDNLMVKMLAADLNNRHNSTVQERMNELIMAQVGIAAGADALVTSSIKAQLTPEVYGVLAELLGARNNVIG